MKFLKSFFITVLIGDIAIMGFQSLTKEENKVYDNLVKECKEEAYPKDVLGVIERYNRLKMYIYDENAKDSEVEELAKWQKKMYHSDLLTINTIESIIKGIREEKVKLKEEKLKLIKLEVVNGSLESPSDNKNIAYIKVKEYTNKGNEDVILYIFVKDNKNQWKIMGFKNERKIESGE